MEQRIIKQVCKKSEDRKELKRFLSYVRSKGVKLNEEDVRVLCNAALGEMQRSRKGSQASVFKSLIKHRKESVKDRSKASKDSKGYCYKRMDSGPGKKMVFTKKGQANYERDRREVAQACRKDYGSLSPSCPTRKAWERSISDC